MTEFTLKIYKSRNVIMKINLKKYGSALFVGHNSISKFVILIDILILMIC